MSSQDSISSGNSDLWKKLGIAGATLLLALVVLQNAWVSDDAYITFRTIDNFLHGHGLRWNAAERVNANTHPLWMFLNAGFFLLSKQTFYVSIAVSIGVTLASALVLGIKVARFAGAAVLALTILCFSKAFVDFSTSGLENPLTHLIAVLFLYFYLTSESPPKEFFLLSLLAGLALCNRMDSGLLFLPALCHGLWRNRNLRGLRLLALGMLPFFAWEVFSVIYYGFPFPNTAYAKLNTGIGPGALVHQGLLYLKDSLTRDPLTLSAIGAGIGLAVWRKDKRLLCVAGGILLYLAYTVRIGGDFMAGRFLTAPLVLSAGLIATTCEFRNWEQATLSVTAAIMIGALATFSPILTRANYGTWKPEWVADSGIADERGFYFRTAGLLNAGDFAQMPAHGLALRGKRFRQLGPVVLAISNAGYEGYFAGPEPHLMDLCALGDPLLARLPAMEVCGTWRIGHFIRQVPDGYLDTLCTGSNVLQDEGIREYYDRLRIVTQGDLFDAQRWKEIWNLNMGKYDYLLDGFVREPMDSVPFSQIAGDGSTEQASQKISPRRFGHSGIQVNLPGISHAQTLGVRLAGNAAYLLVFCKDQTGLGQYISCFLPMSNTELRSINAIVPRKAQESGYNNIKLLPLYGDGSYAIADLVLPSISVNDKRLDGEWITEWLTADPGKGQVTGHKSLPQWTWLNSDYAEAFSLRGYANQEAGDSNRAIKDYNKAIEWDPDYAEAYLNRGGVFLTKGDSNRAIEDYTKLIDLRPLFLDEAYQNRGAARLVKGEIDLAIKDYTKAIELKPDNTLAYSNRAAAYRRTKEYDKAWADVKSCRERGGTPSPKMLELLQKESGRSE